MTESENEKIVEKIVDALNRRDFEAYLTYFSDDVTFVMPSGRTVDKEWFRKELPIGSPASPDQKTSIDRMVSQGDTVWVESTITGTHTADWYGMPAFNKKFEYPSVAIYNFEAGKVKLVKTYWDRLRLFNQIQEKAVAELWDKMRRK